MMLIPLILIVAVVYYFYKKEGFIDKSDALNLLEIKFAKGEISEEEYLSKKRILKGGM